jgi:prohibitin 1
MTARLGRVLAVGLAAMAFACATVEPGHSTVLMNADGTMSQLDEGVTLVSPLAEVDDFSLREQSPGKRFFAISADGAPIVASDAVVTYRLVPNQLIAVDREIGPEFETSVIEPIVQSTVRRVLGSYRADEFDTPHIREAEKRITALAAERLLPKHILLEEVVLKAVYPDLPGLTRVISETEAWAQYAQETRTRIEVARKEAVRLRQQAEGIAAANRSLSATLSRNVLNEAAQRAWLSLLTSPSTTVRIAGNGTSLELEAP